jgi:nitrous oxide reductase accessory protein NosL
MKHLGRRRRFLCLAMGAGTLLVAGCERSLDQPADPVWGKQPCAHCAMLVSERPHAAQATLEDGRRLYFDDIGCLVSSLEAERAATRGAWVRDGAAERWLDARSARYRSGARTPMDFGFEAHPAGGLSYDEMRALVLARIARERSTP